MQTANMAHLIDATTSRRHVDTINRHERAQAEDYDPEVEPAAPTDDELEYAHQARQAQYARLESEPFAKAVAQSIEVGVVVPSILRLRLEQAGYQVIDDEAKLADYGFKSLGVLKRTIVVDPATNTIIAMGAAGDHGEAIVHAALGWMREHKVEGDNPTTGFAVVPGATALGKPQA